MEKINGPGDSGKSTDLLFRLVSSTALSLGIVSGGLTLSSTDDRIRKAEVGLELAIRDERIRSLLAQQAVVNANLQELRNDIARIDRSGPATGNDFVLRQLDGVDKRLDALEKK